MDFEQQEVVVTGDYRYGALEYDRNCLIGKIITMKSINI